MNGSLKFQVSERGEIIIFVSFRSIDKRNIDGRDIITDKILNVCFIASFLLLNSALLLADW